MGGRKRAGTGVVVLMAVLMAGAGLCLADEDGKPSREEQITSDLAKAWSTLYEGNLDESIRLTGPLTKHASNRRFRWAALEAGHIRARALWKRDEGKSRKQALTLWKTLSGASTRNAVRQRQTIVRALRLRASLDTSRPPSGQPRLKEAIGLLEQLAEKDAPNTAMSEAKILLARLQGEAGEFGKAKETLNSVIKKMNDEERVRRMEIPPEVARVFTRAARKTKKELDYQRGDGRKKYEQARNLQNEAQKTTGKERQKKYAKAITLYREVTEKFPDSTYAPRSRLQIGHCLVGLDRPDRAISHWDQFVTEDKAGAYRGQVYVALIDLLLERRLDLDEAWKYAEMARGAIDKALDEEESAPSWKKAAREVWLRIGLVSLCRDQ
ncbi:MAG: tetratricopeptide repeat protein, partial [Planctomycetota bacterium]